MSNLNMRIITEDTGFGMTITWRDEKEYQLGKEFLTHIGAKTRQSGESPDETAVCYYLEQSSNTRLFLTSGDL